MAKLSDYMEDRIINFMRNVAITGEAAVYVALFTADDGLEAGTITSEVSGGAYARQLAGLATPGTPGVSENAADITFPAATAAWGTVVYVALMDAATAGNVIMHGTVDTPKVVGSGDTFKINAGELDTTIA